MTRLNACFDIPNHNHQLTPPLIGNNKGARNCYCPLLVSSAEFGYGVIAGECHAKQQHALKIGMLLASYNKFNYLLCRRLRTDKPKIPNKPSTTPVAIR